jgi:hypothetical protein
MRVDATAGSNAARSAQNHPKNHPKSRLRKPETALFLFKNYPIFAVKFLGSDNLRFKFLSNFSVNF